MFAVSGGGQMEDHRVRSRLFSGVIASVFVAIVALTVTVTGTGLETYTSASQQVSSVGSTGDRGSVAVTTTDQQDLLTASPSGDDHAADLLGDSAPVALGSPPDELAMVDEAGLSTDRNRSSAAGVSEDADKAVAGASRVGLTRQSTGVDNTEPKNAGKTSTNTSATNARGTVPSTENVRTQPTASIPTTTRAARTGGDPKITVGPTTVFRPVTTARRVSNPTTRKVGTSTSVPAAVKPVAKKPTVVKPSTASTRRGSTASTTQTATSIAKAGTQPTSSPTTSKPTTATPATTKLPAKAPTTKAPTTKAPTTGSSTTSPANAGLAAKALFVDGTNGYGGNPGTEQAPFKRPIEALVKAEPGTTIYLRGGTYSDQTHGTNIIRRSGTPDNWIRITPYPGERVELVAGGQWGNGFEVQAASYIEISGFVIRGRSDSIHGSGVFGKDGAHDVRVANNYIEGFGGAGISFVKSSRVRIEGNEVRNNAMRSHYQGSGISLYRSEGAAGAGISNVIRNNYVVGNRNEVRATDGRITDGNCIILDELDLSGYQGSTLIENNVCLENGGRGVLLFWSSNVTARNNTLIGNGWSPELSSGRGEMAAGHGTNIVFNNNLVFNRSGVSSFVRTNAQATFTNNYVMSGPPPDAGNHLLNPDRQYFNGASASGPVTNFRPTSSSGLAGTGRSDLQSTHDLSGRSRSAPGTVGALEQ